MAAVEILRLFFGKYATPEYLLGREAAKSARQEKLTLPVSSFFCQFLHESISFTTFLLDMHV
jgi:hypothetical protein